MKIKSLANSISPGELQLFEEELHGELPQDYKAFLLKYNCASVKPDCFLLNYEQGREEGFNSIRYLFGLCDLSWCSLRDFQKEYSQRMPIDLLPIGTDPDDSYICLSIKGDDLGKVYFWDRHFEVFDREPDYSNVFFIAESFTEFLNNLIDCKELFELRKSK